MCADRARDHAARLSDAPAADDSDAPPGRLYGLPIAIKDLRDVAGVRSTRGSPIFADYVPEKSDLLVTNLEARGGIVLAKSNTPEFGAGANTFNEVFGKTRNPWNTDKTCGGSSGGSDYRAGGRAGVAGVRQRLRRQPEDTRQLLLGRRIAPHAGPHLQRAGRASVRHSVGRGAYGQNRRRRRADAGTRRPGRTWQTP